MKVGTDTLTGAALDWATAWASLKVGAPWATIAELDAIEADPARRTFRPTEDWGAAAPLLDGLRVNIEWGDQRQTDGRILHRCHATVEVEHKFKNYTTWFAFRTDALDERVAKLRCYIAFNAGHQIDVPASLIEFERQALLPQPVPRPAAVVDPAEVDGAVEDDETQDAESDAAWRRGQRFGAS